MQGDFGDPVNGTPSYTLCLYDQSGGTPVFKMEAGIAAGGTCPTKPCWKAIFDKAYGDRNKDGNDGGITKVAFKGGDAGKPSLQVAGKGISLPLPAPISGSEFFDQDTAVIVQLHSSSPVACWSSTFDGSSTKKNDGVQFKATAVTP